MQHGDMGHGQINHHSQGVFLEPHEGVVFGCIGGCRFWVQRVF